MNATRAAAMVRVCTTLVVALNLVFSSATACCAATSSVAAKSAASRVLDRELHSKSLAGNMIGTDPARRVSVYLPPGYDGSSGRYPVIYYFPNAFEDYRVDFDRNDARGLFDRAIAAGVIGKFIVVAADMTTPLGCSWYVNSPVTGHWEDFVITELVPYVDANFKTLPERASRGIAGDRLGGYGAIRLAMRHPEVFGSVTPCIPSERARAF